MDTIAIDRHDAEIALQSVKTVRELSIKNGLFDETSLLAFSYEMTIEAIEGALSTPTPTDRPEPGEGER